MSILSTYFDKVGFDDVEQYDSVDYRDMTLPPIGQRSGLPLGNYGIIQTNINIITEAKEKGWKTVLTIEDDTYFTDEVYKFKEYMDLVPDDWDMIYIGGNHTDGTTPIKVNDKIIRLNKTIATHCVAFKHTVYDKILEITKPRMKAVDFYYSLLHPTINAYGFTPSMARQTPGYSDIMKQNVDYNEFF
jgi:hypothetical protein